MQSFDEHGMSCLKYNSRTIFCTFPFLEDLTNTLLETFAAWGFEEISLCRLFMVY